MTDGGIIQSLLSNTWGIVLVVFFFCGSIFIHELGHFLAAKWRGLRIVRFSIGFGPKILSWKHKGIDYCISLLPFGGYVLLPQLAELGPIEGDAKEPAEDLPPISYTDRMIVSVAGAVFNIIFALVLACIIWGVGRPSSEAEQTTTIGYVVQEIEDAEGNTIPSPAYAAGIQAGDRITAIDGSEVDSFKEIQERIVTGIGRDSSGQPQTIVTVERAGETLTFQLTPILQEMNSGSKERMRAIGVYPRNGIIARNISPNSPGEKAGLKDGDKILSLEGSPIHSGRMLVEGLTSREGIETELTVERTLEAETVQKTLKITPQRNPVKKPLLHLYDKAEEGKRMLSLFPHYLSEKQQDPASPSEPSQVSVYEIRPNTELAAQLQFGDVISKINGQPVDSLQNLNELVNTQIGEKWELSILRQDAPLEVSIEPLLKSKIEPAKTQVLIGFLMSSERITIYPNPIEQFSNKISTTLLILKGLISPKSNIAVKNMSGPVGISRVLHRLSLDDIRLVIWFTILLNINLAILNLLPIPVLDGGHMLFATIGKLKGSPLNPNLIAGTQSLFVIMLFGMMGYVLFYDSLRWSGDYDAEQEMRNAFRKEQAHRIDVRFTTPDKE